MTRTADLVQHIRSIEELQGVTRTMKGFASVRARQFERAVEALTEYELVIHLGLQALVRRGLRPAIHPPGTSAARRVVMAFGSQQGLCGPVNRRVASRAMAELAEAPDAGTRPLVLAVGARLALELEGAGVTVDETFDLPGSPDGISERAISLLARLGADAPGNSVPVVTVVYPRPGRAGHYDVVSAGLLPASDDLFAIGERPWPTRQIPALAVEDDQVLAGLIRELAFTALHRTIAESLASVHAARRAAMQRAEQNIDERLVELRLALNQARQAEITGELLDIVAGSEAQRTEAELLPE